MNECVYDGASRSVLTQRLFVQHDRDAPRCVKKIQDIILPAWAPDCRKIGGEKFGQYFVIPGAFQRLGVSPDGSRVVFEIREPCASVLGEIRPGLDDICTNLPWNNVGASTPVLKSGEEGIFVVSADLERPSVDGDDECDNAEVRRVGDPSNEDPFRLDLDFGSYATLPTFRFSPDGKKVVFTDRPGDPGARCHSLERDRMCSPVQVVTVDLDNGERTIVSRLGELCPLFDFLYVYPPVTSPGFADQDTVAFSTILKSDPPMSPDPGRVEVHRVAADGSGRGEVQPPPIAIPGATVFPGFSITGDPTTVSTVLFREPDDSVCSIESLEFVGEVFVSSHEDVLQLTGAGRGDTGIEGGLWAPIRLGDRVYFTASIPGPQNPNEDCQIFSASLLGGQPEQIGFLQRGELDGSTGALPDCACGGCLSCCSYEPNCHAAIFALDNRNRRLIFHSGCDPVGLSPRGSQLYAMRVDDGTVEQLTHARGLVELSGGRVMAEVPGPYAFANP
jgi:hypothetical protein